MATELAKAYVQIVPSAEGISGSISNLMSGESTSAGESSGNTFGNSMVSKIKTVIAAAGIATMVQKIVSSAVEIGTATETAYAKLETIAGTDSIDALTESLRTLSDQTGVSCADLADVAYNAISAGASAETAMDMVTAATKLGVAGFTDSSSALSVLSTAMNAYGDAAGTVEEISDSLIMVQNLGVTTIDELSGSIGKAIATGSAYGVSLGNIESSYVSITKAGIGTQEATTYLNAMLNELGTTGSTVSDIIQNETGQSFSELMDSGASLGDVLQILYDYCEGDATAMANLWSSSQAGLASNALVNQGLDEFNENLALITDSAGSTEDAYSTMADTMETKMQIMKTSLSNLGLSVYDGLEGPMSSAIGFITDTVIPGIQTLMDDFGEFADGIDLGPITEAFSNLWDKISPLVDGVSNGLKWAYDNVLKPLGEWTIQTALPAILNALAVAAETFGNVLTTAWDSISGLVGGFVEKIQGKLSDLGISFEDGEGIIQKFQEGWERMCNLVGALFDGAFSIVSSVLGTVLDVLLGLFDIFAGIFTGNWEQVWDGVSGIFSGIWEGITGIFSAVGDTILNILDIFLSVFGTSWEEIWGGISEFFTNIWEGISGFFEGIFNGIFSFFSGILNGISTAWTNVWGAVSNFFTSIWNGISSTVSTAINAVKTTITTVINAVKTTITNVLNTIKSIFTTAFNAVKNTVSTAMSTVKTTISNITSTIKNTFTNLVNSAKTWAKDMINNFIQGIKDKISAVGDAVKGVASKVKSILGFSLPEDGPLANADTYMPDFMDLLAKGIKDNEDEVVSNVEDLASAVSDAATITAGGVEIEGSASSGSSLDDLADLLTQFVDELESLEVRLDDGTLVGKIAPRMNTALRKIALKEARQ